MTISSLSSAARRARAWRDALLLATLVTGATAWAQQVDEKARAQAFRAFAIKESERYTFRRAGASGPALSRRPESLLQWTNPVLGSICGEVFVWTEKGRPLVLGSFYRWFEPFRHRANEFTSLASTPLEVEREGVHVWTTPGPGVTFRPIPDAPPPGATATQRLRQMRELARDFTARHTDGKGIERDLRLLSQPLDRYETTEDDAADGGLFVFVLGTDPEAVLLIECHPSQGKPRWDYALARMNHQAIRVSHRGRPVWAAPGLPYATAVRPHTETYTEFVFKPGEDPTPPPEVGATP